MFAIEQESHGKPNFNQPGDVFMNKRHRGRNRKSNQNNYNPNRSVDSNGPDVKIRGNANTIFEKYTNLARDAASSGYRVKAENYLQHAEHYLRLVNELKARAEALAEQKEKERETRRGTDA